MTITGDGPKRGHATILVVDDETMIRNIVTWTLKRRGFAVLQASDGVDGLQSFEAHREIDLVLSDIVMPELDGVGMVRALRDRRPEVPVLFMSGYTGHQGPALEPGDLERLLPKPFTPTELVERIEQVLAAS